MNNFSMFLCGFQDFRFNIRRLIISEISCVMFRFGNILIVFREFYCYTFCVNFTYYIREREGI